MLHKRLGCLVNVKVISERTVCLCSRAMSPFVTLEIVAATLGTSVPGICHTHQWCVAVVVVVVVVV